MEMSSDLIHIPDFAGRLEDSEYMANICIVRKYHSEHFKYIFLART